MQENVINEFDTIEFCIDKCKCKFDINTQPTGQNLGIYYNTYNTNIFFRLSCKLFSTATSLGAITRYNYTNIAERIEKLCGIIIQPDYLYTEVPLNRVDIKKDRCVEEDPCFYISDLYRLFKHNTDKYEVHKYEDLHYNNGLSLVPKTHSKHRYSIYNKGHEVSRYKNKKYREQFDYEFYENLQFCLRTELQLKDSENIKRVFQIDKNEIRSFKNIFSKNIDVIGEEFGKLFKFYGCEV